MIRDRKSLEIGYFLKSQFHVMIQGIIFPRLSILSSDNDFIGQHNDYSRHIEYQKLCGLSRGVLVQNDVML